MRPEVRLTDRLGPPPARPGRRPSPAWLHRKTHHGTSERRSGAPLPCHGRSTTWSTRSIRRATTTPPSRHRTITASCVSRTCRPRNWIDRPQQRARWLARHRHFRFDRRQQRALRPRLV